MKVTLCSCVQSGGRDSRPFETVNSEKTSVNQNVPVDTRLHGSSREEANDDSHDMKSQMSQML